MKPTVYAPGGVVVSMPSAELAKLCHSYGATLPIQGTDDGTGKPIDGPTLLWAMSGRESSFGRNLKPRHEPAFDIGGRYAGAPEVAEGLARYGSAFACSYGPLQIMACNATGFTPQELAENPEHALGSAVARLRLVVLGHQGARTIAQICECWNDGHIVSGKMLPAKVASYVAEVQKHYAAGFPEIVATRETQG